MSLPLRSTKVMRSQAKPLRPVCACTIASENARAAMRAAFSSENAAAVLTCLPAPVAATPAPGVPVTLIWPFGPILKVPLMPRLRRRDVLNALAAGVVSDVSSVTTTRSAPDFLTWTT